MQEADDVMTKLASAILYEENGNGNTALLKDQIKAVEASQWYDSGKKHTVKKAGEQGARRWCKKCKKDSHNTKYKKQKRKYYKAKKLEEAKKSA